MEIEVINKDEKVSVKPMGRLDSSTSGEFEEKLKEILKSDLSGLTIDMSEVDFISSKGLRVLVSAYKALEGKEFVLTGVNASVHEVIKLSGLLKVFTIK